MISIKVSSGERGGTLPAKPVEETLFEIEAAQAGLRDSIEQARDLADESDRLVLKHRAETAKPHNPAS